MKTQNPRSVLSTPVRPVNVGTACEVPDPQMTVHRAQDIHEKLLAELNEAIGNLQARLQPIIRPYPTPPPGDSKAPQQTVSPVVERILQHNDVIYRAISCVRSMVELVDV